MGVFDGAYGYHRQQQMLNQLGGFNSEAAIRAQRAYMARAMQNVYQEPQGPIDGGELKAEPVEVLALPAPSDEWPERKRP